LTAAAPKTASTLPGASRFGRWRRRRRSTHRSSHAPTTRPPAAAPARSADQRHPWPATAAAGPEGVESCRRAPATARCESPSAHGRASGRQPSDSATRRSAGSATAARDCRGLSHWCLTCTSDWFAERWLRDGSFSPTAANAARLRAVFAWLQPRAGVLLFALRQCGLGAEMLWRGAVRRPW
jgi:hypothetical protein